MSAPVATADLVADQRVGRGGIGDAQQRLGEAHQRDAFLGREGERVHQRIGAGRITALGAHLAGEVAGQRLRALPRFAPQRGEGQQRAHGVGLGDARRARDRLAQRVLWPGECVVERWACVCRHGRNVRASLAPAYGTDPLSTARRMADPHVPALPSAPRSTTVRATLLVPRRCRSSCHSSPPSRSASRGCRRAPNCPIPHGGRSWPAERARSSVRCCVRGNRRLRVDCLAARRYRRRRRPAWPGVRWRVPSRSWPEACWWGMATPRGGPRCASPMHCRRCGKARISRSSESSTTCRDGCTTASASPSPSSASTPQGRRCRSVYRSPGRWGGPTPSAVSRFPRFAQASAGT